MKYVIIGLGAAGASAAEELRRRNANAEITVLNGEAQSFYLRLDLEALFFGKEVEQLRPRPESFWTEQKIEIIPQRAVQVKAEDRTVILADGQKLNYDKLLVACGAQPVLPNWPGKELSGIHVYRTLEDALSIMAVRERVKNAVIVGGGILGMELAYIATSCGWKATLLVRGKHVGSPLLDTDGGAFVLKRMQEKQVAVIFEDEVSIFEGKDGVLGAVKTKQGHQLAAELAVICVGVKPDLSFLPANLLTEGKLIVNERLQTPDEHIFAAGDAVTVKDSSGKMIPSFTWKAAAAEALVAAANMSGCDEVWKEGILYDLDTFFDLDFSMIGSWSERHAVGNTMLDLSTAKAYRKLVLRDGKLIGAMLVGDRNGDRRIRKIIADGGAVEGEFDSIFM